MPANPPTDLAQLENVYWRLLELRPSYPGAPLIKIRPDWREQQPPKGPAAALFRRHLSNVRSILDVGAGARIWESVLASLAPAASYASADIDRLHRHDFGDFLAVEERFDAILMLELLEHLPLELGLQFIGHAIRLLNAPGVLVIGTPNPAHAHHIWSVDVTHVRPWPAHDLWSVCQVAGLTGVEVYRQMVTTRRRQLAAPIQVSLSRLLGLDPAVGLLLFAHKPADA